MTIDFIEEYEAKLRVEGATKQVRPDLGVTFFSKKILQIRYTVDVGLTVTFTGSLGRYLLAGHHLKKPELTHDKRAIDQ